MLTLCDILFYSSPINICSTFCKLILVTSPSWFLKCHRAKRHVSWRMLFWLCSTMLRIIVSSISWSSCLRPLFEKKSRMLTGSLCPHSQQRDLVFIVLSCRSKVDKISDIITGNPTVIKMVVHFTRYHIWSYCTWIHLGFGRGGQNILRDLLGPLVQEVLNNKDLTIITSPVDVYKAWINQMETKTGEARYKGLNSNYRNHIHWFG